VLGPRNIGDPKGRYLRMLSRLGGSWITPPDLDLYIRRMGEPGHALAGSRWYRTGETSEIIRWMRVDRR